MQCFESQRKETKGNVKKELERGNWKSLEMTESFVSASIKSLSVCDSSLYLVPLRNDFPAFLTALNASAIFQPERGW